MRSCLLPYSKKHIRSKHICAKTPVFVNVKLKTTNFDDLSFTNYGES